MYADGMFHVHRITKIKQNPRVNNDNIVNEILEIYLDISAYLT